jgi:hypothetical protein
VQPSLSEWDTNFALRTTKVGHERMYYISIFLLKAVRIDLDEVYESKVEWKFDITRSKGTTIETLFKIDDICSSNPTRMT